MSPLAVASIVLICCFSAAVLGMVLHGKLPGHHLDGESKDVVKLVMGLIATISALVLGLLIASATSSYDRQVSQLKLLSADVILLDRSLEMYGPDAAEARAGLHDFIRSTHDVIWSPDGARPDELDSSQTRRNAKGVVELMLQLKPKTDQERVMQSRALQETEKLAEARILMFEELETSIAWPFLTVLVFWICMLFLGFGLLARAHATVTLAILVGALSVAGALFLILELNDPYSGLIRISDRPLLNAMNRWDQ